jgi:trans-aconitate methyltransferase
MSTDDHLALPPKFDWRSWVVRYDSMQQRYLPRRDERLGRVVQLIRSTQNSVTRVADLGCGTGSLTALILESFPDVHVYGIDLDPTVLPLARERLCGFGDCAHLLRRDLRNESWVNDLPRPLDAAVSATALHWLSPSQMERLYGQLGHVIRKAGIFLNADHVSSESASIQQAWASECAETRAQEGSSDNESWEEFWRSYLEALGVDACRVRAEALGEWEGSESGLSLSWHLDRLRANGFIAVDCFWRCGFDAIYGGIRA